MERPTNGSKLARIGEDAASKEPDSITLYTSMQQAATELLDANPTSPIFRVDLDIKHNSLSKIFLTILPAKHQQKFNCSACLRFMERYGCLALVSDNGSVLPLFWPGKPSQDVFHDSIVAVRRLFDNKKVEKPFIYTASERYAGARSCCKGSCYWKHMTFDFQNHGRLPIQSSKSRGIISTTDLAAMLQRLLEDYSLAVVRKADQIITGNKLRHVENHKAAIRWLLKVKESGQLEHRPDETQRYNLICRVATSAFTGCLSQLRSGALGTVLKNIKDGVAFHDLERQWNAINRPLAYMQPQVAPAAGNLATAERLFAGMGLTENDLWREYLATTGIPDAAFIYRSKKGIEQQTSKGGIFANVKAKVKDSSSGEKLGLGLPPSAMTFATFVNKILPQAKKVEYHLPARIDLYFLITGLLDTAPLMQWHESDNKNRASWYTHEKPQQVADHGLCTGWVGVSYIVPFPHLWDGVPATTTFPLSEENGAFKYYHTKNGFRYLVGLEGIEEKEKGVRSLCLFPTLLKSQFHGVRSTIESYSKQGRIEGKRREVVGGIQIDRSRVGKHRFRVTDARGMRDQYEATLFE